MAEIIAYGFGTYLDELKWRKDWRESLIETLPEPLKSDFELAWEDNKEDFDGDKEEFFEDYVNEYDDIAGYSTEGFLADCINASEFGGKLIVQGTDLTIYAQPRFPKAEDDVLPTKGELLEAMKKWLGYIGKNADKLEYRYNYWREL